MHNNLGLVVGKFAPPHLGHVLLIDTALASCEQVLVLVYSNPDFFDMPSFARAAWIRKHYAHEPRLRVHVPENPPSNLADDFAQREFVRLWLKKNNVKASAVFGSEEYIPGFAAHLGATAHLVDAKRLRFPTSGTLLRQAWASVRTNKNTDEKTVAQTTLRENMSQEIFAASKIWRDAVYKIVFLGAESTGKSTLAARMAEELDCWVVPEYGREVWQNKKGDLTASDYIHIAQHHRELEEQAVLRAEQSGKPFVFIDTNAITTAFLAFAYEGDAPEAVMQIAKEAETRYQYVFLCGADIVFEQDGWRDDAVWRSRAQNMVRYDLRVRDVYCQEIFGDLKTRFEKVRKIIFAEQNNF